MSKEKKNTMEPELRFPEFKDSWSFLNGDELFEQISDKIHNSDLPILAITQEYGAIPREKIDYNVSVTDKSIESYKVVQVGDFIISLRSFQGGIEYSEYKGLCSPAYIILRKKKEKQVVNEFFKYYFKTKAFIRDLNKNLEGIRDGKMVSYKQFSDIKSPYPKSEEQQKITSCLSSLDELITAQIQKLDALKAYKKGLVHKLFPAEGEKVPKLRFDEFKERVWDKVLLSDASWYQEGPGLRNWQFTNEGIRVINITNIVDGFLDLSLTNRHISWEEFNKMYKHFSVDAGDIVMASSGNSYCKHGIVREQDLPLVMNTSVIRFKTKETCEYEFLNQFLKSSFLKNQIDLLITGGAQPNFGPAHLAKVYIPLPEKDEQQKIATCLSSLDEIISAQTEKIIQLKNHKNGLMQGLFPIVNK